MARLRSPAPMSPTRSITPPARRRRTSPRSPPRAPRQAQPTPLMRAMMKGRQGCLEDVLVAIGCDPEASRMPFFEHGVEFPLSFALRHGCTADIVRALLVSGADPNGKDLQGRSPLLVLSDAAAPKVLGSYDGFTSWAIEIAMLLMSRGADPLETDSRGRTAIVAAHEHGCAPLADAFESYRATQARFVLRQAEDTRGGIGSLRNVLTNFMLEFL